jgi:hypothetical protein
MADTAPKALRSLHPPEPVPTAATDPNVTHQVTVEVLCNVLCALPTGYAIGLSGWTCEHICAVATTSTHRFRASFICKLSHLKALSPTLTPSPMQLSLANISQRVGAVALPLQMSAIVLLVVRCEGVGCWDWASTPSSGCVGPWWQ